MVLLLPLSAPWFFPVNWKKCQFIFLLSEIRKFKKNSQTQKNETSPCQRRELHISSCSSSPMMWCQTMAVGWWGGICLGWHRVEVCSKIKANYPRARSAGWSGVLRWSPWADCAPGGLSYWVTPTGWWLMGNLSRYYELGLLPRDGPEFNRMIREFVVLFMRWL